MAEDAPITGSEIERSYKVLARKYRPQSFDDMIGHEAMVQTLSNAFETGRIAHAFILTGVRGIGKTTTARILARALNYVEPDGDDRPTIHMKAEGTHCRSIAEGRHMDVIEMDAASRTGIGDIREVIESVRFLPVSARYKVYIIDEVHMLSNAAFNGLLKTLEEPPPHVKFIFCTTEIRKVPVTVLSRCQRFDLKRIGADVLIPYMEKICTLEGANVAGPGFSLIARAAEGSVRDGLSLLDQAIALGAGAEVSEEQVRDMLGLADRARVIDLFDALMKGEIADALAELRSQYDAGADPAVIIADLLEWTHWVTRLKVARSAGRDAAMSEAEAKRGQENAEKLPLSSLTRAWQLLLKGLDEVRRAPHPISAAEMVLVRLAYAADLPTPGDLVRQLKNGDGATSKSAPQAAGAAPAATSNAPRSMGSVGGGNGPGAPNALLEPTVMSPVTQQGPVLQTFQDVIALADAERDIRLKTALEDFVHPVAFAPGRIEIRLAPEADRALIALLSKRLQEWTGERWLISQSSEVGAPTVQQQKRERESQKMTEAKADPLVQAALEIFPGAKIIQVVDRQIESQENPPTTTNDDDDDENFF